MQRLIPIFACCTILLALFGAGSAWAAKLPDYYPNSFHFAGNVSSVELRNRTLVINDRKFLVANDAPVYSVSSKFGTLRDLRPGTLVGITHGRSERGQRIITGVWILPDRMSMFPKLLRKK